MNGINLSWKFLRGKLWAKLASWLCHEAVLFGAALLDARFEAAGALTVDEQFQLRSMLASRRKRGIGARADPCT